MKINEKFYAPKPFSLINLTGELYILGGEIALINIKALGASPDTIQLKLSPTQSP